MDAYGEVERELARVVDRLTSMPLAKAELATPAVEAAAATLLDQLRIVDDAVPTDAELPHLAPPGLGALIAVLGADWLDATRASSEPRDPGPVLDALVTLRRALP